jgi:Na+-driven multidrug efflux pump
MPLAFWEMMAYGEWQVLTILAAHNGQSEVAAFGLLGTLWEFFESFTERIGEAAIIRVGYFLGKGNPRSAKMSGYRSAMIGTVMACVVTSIF